MSENIFNEKVGYMCIYNKKSKVNKVSVEYDNAGVGDVVDVDVDVVVVVVVAIRIIIRGRICQIEKKRRCLFNEQSHHTTFLH